MKFKKPDILTVILGIVIVLPYLGIGGMYLWNNHKSTTIENSCFVVVSKQAMTLSVYDYKGNEKCKFPIACGVNFGNKEKKGDLKTPEGIFRITDIEISENWGHDFGDGNGKIPGAYGPYFIRLYTPGHRGIGIHGTHDNNSLGTRATEGCIRLKNEDVLEFVKFIHPGSIVLITPSADDVVIKNEIEESTL